MKLDEAEEVQVAFFDYCRVKTGGRNVSLVGVLKGTREGRWSKLVSELRKVPYGSSAYNAMKMKLPCFMVSASTATGGHKASDLEKHSGLLQLDVDGLSDTEALKLRDALGSDPHVLAAWISPGGVGVKGIMRIPASVEDHKRSFMAASDYMVARYAVEIDKACSDPCRLCFVSHDPDLTLNESSLPLVISEPLMPPPAADFEQAGSQPEEDSPPLLNTESASCILHNTLPLFQQFPRLLPLYDQQVVKRLGTPQPGLRNDALVELVAGTFCVVHPRFVLAFAETFHQAAPVLFADYPLEQWMREAKALLDGCLRDYPKKSLGPAEAIRYVAMPDESHGTTFRVCRSLSMCESDASTPPPEFFLSAAQLAARLGVLEMQAWRILKCFEKRGVIKTVEKGDRRAAGQKAKATRWKWQSD